MTNAVSVWTAARSALAAAGILCVLTVGGNAGDGSLNTPETGTVFKIKHEGNEPFQSSQEITTSDGVRYTSVSTSRDGQRIEAHAAYGFFYTRFIIPQSNGEPVILEQQFDEDLAASVFPLVPGKTVQVPVISKHRIGGRVLATTSTLSTLTVGQKSRITVDNETYDVYQVQVDYTTTVGPETSSNTVQIHYADDLGFPLRTQTEFGAQAPGVTMTSEVIEIKFPGEATENLAR